MKYYATICFLVLSIESYSQNDFLQLKGEWIVDSIINKRTNEITIGKYGIMGEYVKFDFKSKSSLFVANSPIDIGVEVPIEVRKKVIKVVSVNIYPQQLSNMGIYLPLPPILSEASYTIRNLVNNSLILETFDSKDTIVYYFTRPEKQVESVISIVMPFILIEYKTSDLHFKVAQNNFPIRGYNKVLPHYENYYSFAWHISHSIDLSNTNLEENILSKEVSIKLVIDPKGKVEEVNIESGIDKKIDESILQIIKNSKWTKIDNIAKCIIKVNIVFLKSN